MKLILFILALITICSASCTESEAKDEPKYYNCTLIAKTPFWAMYEVQTKDGSYIVVDGTTDIEVLKK